MVKRRGLMLVLSSPSGAGKTSIARTLLKQDAQLTMSVSATTRRRRPGEVEGKDYFFIDEMAFKTKINQGYFLEYAEVFDHFYGTPADTVNKTLNEGRDVLFDIDWQGTQQIKASARQDLVSIFILPPSTPELKRRLLNRAQDSAEVVSARMAQASDEISHYAEYEYIVVNHDAEESLGQIRAILTAERLKRARQTGLSDFVHGLREAL